MPRTKKPDKKKEAYEDLDYLKQIENAPNDTAANKIVVDDIKEGEARHERAKSDAMNAIQGQARHTYRTRLAAYAQAGLETITWPEGGIREAVATDGSDI